MMPSKWITFLSGAMLIFSLSGCQHLMPKAQGLASSQWIAQDYQRQDQVEVQWKDHSFSFLLYQQQQGKMIDFIALTLTGQQLFKLNFDGEKVQVEQRIDQMKLLPFDFVVRDILFATYPDFVKLHQQEGVQNHIQVIFKDDQDLDPSVSQKLDESIDQNLDQKMPKTNQEILINHQKVLNIHTYQDHIELDNVQVPYQMIFSEVANTLENNE